MTLPTPKVEMVKAFLKLKNWTVEQSTTEYEYFAPPKEFEFEEQFNFKIPLNEEAHDYKEYIIQIIFSIASMYDLNKWSLVQDLSKSLLEVQTEIENHQKAIAFKEKLLAFAS